MDVFEHLEEMDADKAEAKAAFILNGLGFTKEMQYQKVGHLFPHSALNY